MAHANRRLFVRDAIITTMILVGLSALTYGVQVQPLQIPGYILLIGFGTIGGATGPEAWFPVVFGSYLLSLGTVSVIAVRTVQRRIPEEYIVGWRRGVAGAFGVTGLLSVLFAVAILMGTSQMDAVLTTGISGIVLLGLAGWFAGLFTIRMGIKNNHH